MKVYIITDIEGISGISGDGFHLHDGRFFADGRRYYTREINECVAACFDAGVDDVVVRDGHGPGNYLIWDQIDPRVLLFQGFYNQSFFPEGEDADAIICLGFHALAGTSNAVLEHTFSSANCQNLWLNGQLIGEFGIIAYGAAELNIPVIMVSGDDKVCAEARALIPDIVTCEVKRGYGCNAAALLSPDKAYYLIRERTAEAIKNINSISRLKPPKPAVIRKELVERFPYPHKFTLLNKNIKRLNDRLVEVSADSVTEAFLLIN